MRTHLMHAHGIPAWPPDIDTTETSKEPHNKQTGLNNKNILGINNFTMQGTNISGSTQRNEQAVLGKNNETMQGTNPHKLPPITADVNQNVIGTNIDIEAHSSKKPTYNKAVTSLNTMAPDSSPTAEDSVQTSAKSSHIRKINEEHKHRPKPKDKHNRPKLPSPAETETLLIPKQ